MFGPDSKVVTVGLRPASLSQPSAWATNRGAVPMTGITPTRTGIGAVWARAGRPDEAARAIVPARLRKVRRFMDKVSGSGARLCKTGVLDRIRKFFSTETQGVGYVKNIILLNIQIIAYFASNSSFDANGFYRPENPA